MSPWVQTILENLEFKLKNYWVFGYIQNIICMGFAVSCAKQLYTKTWLLYYDIVIANHQY